MHIIYPIYEILAKDAKYMLSVSTESIGCRKLALVQCRSALRQEVQSQLETLDCRAFGK